MMAYWCETKKIFFFRMLEWRNLLLFAIVLTLFARTANGLKRVRKASWIQLKQPKYMYLDRKSKFLD